MKTLAVTLLMLMTSAPFLETNSNELVHWLVDFDQAKTKAKAENKMVLMSFSGSDWCGNCMRLEQSLFESEEFKAFADENVVLLKLDFPAKKKNQLPSEQKKHNEALASKFNKKGVFPLVLLLNSNGEVIGEMSHPERETQAYIDNLKALTKH